MTATSLYQSGICGTGRHGDCRGAYAGTACTCACHSPEGRGPAGLTVVPPATDVTPTVAGGINPVLLALTEAIDGVNAALSGWAKTAADIELLDVLGILRERRQYLAQLESLVEKAAANAMTQDVIEWPGGVATRKWGAKRTAWDHDRLVGRVKRYALDHYAAAFDEATGEVVDDPDLTAAVSSAVDELAACARPNWRTTQLKARGIRFDDACESEPGIRSIVITPAGP